MFKHWVLTIVQLISNTTEHFFFVGFLHLSLINNHFWCITNECDYKPQGFTEIINLIITLDFKQNYSYSVLNCNSTWLYSYNYGKFYYPWHQYTVLHKHFLFFTDNITGTGTCHLYMYMYIVYVQATYISLVQNMHKYNMTLLP